MAVFERLKNSARAALTAYSNAAAASLDALLQLELGKELWRLQADLRDTMPDNPATCGFKVYSQADEDGILEEIARRLELDRGNFIEIGCGDGRENNSHYLLLKGWRGIWVDGDATNIAAIRSTLPLRGRLRVVEQLVDLENVASIPLAARSPEFGDLDLLSVDIDGNDLAIALAATKAWAPKIIIGEYNAKFRFPTKIEVAYDAQHRWCQDDYHGASLAAWIEQLQPRYLLVACNLAGTNAFFVRSDLADRFAAYPPERIFQPARFHLTALRSGHAPSLSFLRDMLMADTPLGSRAL
jgi:hypothetical protein